MGDATNLLEDTTNNDMQTFQLLNLLSNSKICEIVQKKRKMKERAQKYERVRLELRETFEKTASILESNPMYKKLREFKIDELRAKIELKKWTARNAVTADGQRQFQKIQGMIFNKTVVNFVMANKRLTEIHELSLKLKTAIKKENEFEIQEASKKEIHAKTQQAKLNFLLPPLPWPPTFLEISAGVDTNVPEALTAASLKRERSNISDLTPISKKTNVFSDMAMSLSPLKTTVNRSFDPNFDKSVTIFQSSDPTDFTAQKVKTMEEKTLSGKENTSKETLRKTKNLEEPVIKISMPNTTNATLEVITSKSLKNLTLVIHSPQQTGMILPMQKEEISDINNPFMTQDLSPKTLSIITDRGSKRKIPINIEHVDSVRAKKEKNVSFAKPTEETHDRTENSPMQDGDKALDIANMSDSLKHDSISLEELSEDDYQANNIPDLSFASDIPQSNTCTNMVPIPSLDQRSIREEFQGREQL